jgi:hypothetical protein
MCACSNISNHKHQTHAHRCILTSARGFLTRCVLNKSFESSSTSSRIRACMLRVGRTVNEAERLHNHHNSSYKKHFQKSAHATQLARNETRATNTRTGDFLRMVYHHKPLVTLPPSPDPHPTPPPPPCLAHTVPRAPALKTVALVSVDLHAHVVKQHLAMCAHLETSAHARLMVASASAARVASVAKTLPRVSENYNSIFLWREVNLVSGRLRAARLDAVSSCVSNFFACVPARMVSLT